MGRSKSVVVIGDFHCGHYAGLTPPQWHVNKKAMPGVHQVQKSGWDRYRKHVQDYKNPDLLIVNGDLIDGMGKRSGGTELITTDCNAQGEMAAELIEMWGANEIVISRGTPYHTGDDLDHEDNIAKWVGAHIEAQLWVEIGGVTFDIKHHPSGGSSTPNGRHTAVAKDRLWNIIWHNSDEQQPLADVFLRSHVHYHNYCGGPGWLAMTLPALQAPGSKYGKRRCVGTVDWGIVTFEANKGEYTWQSHVTRLEGTKSTKLKL